MCSGVWNDVAPLLRAAPACSGVWNEIRGRQCVAVFATASEGGVDVAPLPRAAVCSGVWNDVAPLLRLLLINR